jgi:hypothetical protein
VRGGPFYGLNADLRRELASEFIGRDVVLVENNGRRKDANRREFEGRVVSVAIPNTSASADVLVLRREGFWDRAFSLATIESLKEARS